MLLRTRLEILPDNKRVGSLLISSDTIFGNVDTVGLLKRATTDHEFEVRFSIPCRDNPRAALQLALQTIYLSAPDLTALEIARPGPLLSLRERDRVEDAPSYARFIGVSAGPNLNGVDPYRVAREFFAEKVRQSFGAMEMPHIAVCTEVQAGGVGESFVGRSTVDPVFKRVLPTMYVNLCQQSDISAPYLDGFKVSRWRNASSTLLSPYHHDKIGSDQFEGACMKHRRSECSDKLCFDGATSVRAVYKRRKLWQLPCLPISEIPSTCESFKTVSEYCGQMLVHAWDNFGPAKFVLAGSVISGSGPDHAANMCRMIRRSFDAQFHETVRNPHDAPDLCEIIRLRSHDYPVSLGTALRAARLTL